MTTEPPALTALAAVASARNGDRNSARLAVLLAPDPGMVGLALLAMVELVIDVHPDSPAVWREVVDGALDAVGDHLDWEAAG